VAQADLDALRRQVLQLEQGSAPVASARFSTGSAGIDAAVGGGLMRGGVHEIFANQILDEPSAASFAVMLALRAAGTRPIIWVRQDFVGLELGEIYAPGLVELGLSPDRLILVRVRDGPSVLRAGEEAARCPPLGAVLIEPWGNPKALDLTASRRLALTAARSNVPLFMVRAGGAPAPSAAMTRWRISSAPSVALEADAPGHPAFFVELLRDRAGASARNWIVEWDRDNHTFRDIAGRDIAGRKVAPRNAQEMAGGMVSLPVGRPDNTPDGERRRAS
jgi:protein ImuA